MRRRSGLLAPAPLLVVLLMGANSPRESWDALFIGNAKVGYIHTEVTPLKDSKGRDLVRVEVTTELNVKRDRDAASMKLRYGAIETPAGEVLRMDTQITTGKDMMRVRGDVADGQMNLALEAGGRKSEAKVPWGADVRGPYGPEMSMVQKPMAPGESRKLKVFLPEMNSFVFITLKAEQKEAVALGGGPRQLLKVTSAAADAAGKSMPEMNTTYYVDEKGEPLKTVTDAFGGMLTYRTTRQAALERGEYASLDLIRSTLIRPKSRISTPYKTQEVRYELTLKGTKPADIIVADARQSLAAGKGPNDAILTIKSLGRDAIPQGPAEAEAKYLAASPLIDAKDARVVEHMRKAVGDATDPWQKVEKIVHWVSGNLRDKNFETTFATASEVARDLSGDCTEHSVLVAAMCRAAGIPCRANVGLIYAENLNGFGFHMWNEAYVDGRWIPVDAAFDQTTVDAVHIKLADTALDGITPFESFLPVIQASNKLTLEPVEVR